MTQDPLALQASLRALFMVPEIMKAHAPELARKLAAGVMAVPGRIVMGDVDGMVVFYHEGGGRYDGHYLFPPWTRGKDILTRGRAFIRTMFTEHGATALRGQTPLGNRPARMVNRALGFVPVGEAANTEGQRCIQYELTRERWRNLQSGLTPPT